METAGGENECAVTDNSLAVASEFPRPRLACFVCSQNMAAVFNLARNVRRHIAHLHPSKPKAPSYGRLVVLTGGDGEIELACMR